MRKVHQPLEWHGPPPVMIGKLNAALRQLETAIDLYFADGDLVAMTSLAGNAHVIFSALAKGRGKPSVIETGLQERKEETGTDDRGPFLASYNFAKHADQEELTATCAFYERQVLTSMLDASASHFDLVRHQSPRLRAFSIWINAERAEEISELLGSDEGFRLRALITETDKATFYKNTLAEIEVQLR